MPPKCTSVKEEGVLIDNFLGVRDGHFREKELVALLTQGRYPARNPVQNIADLKAQIVVDTLYGALGVRAASQGTMNNFTFGNDKHQYYETICGGEGAGEDFPGTDAVHTHMTNSRLTDPEVLEWRFPVRLGQFYIRENSGGEGRHSGGGQPDEKKDR
jgi:N-methylhydantoinase B/oxoprolinase/acetone carboxylase alpha subunit